jgi:hypothetical protein
MKSTFNKRGKFKIPTVDFFFLVSSSILLDTTCTRCRQGEKKKEMRSGKIENNLCMLYLHRQGNLLATVAKEEGGRTFIYFRFLSFSLHIVPFLTSTKVFESS